LPRKVCIITPGTIASNPRVVKEAEALSEAGYHVHLIYTRHVNYLIEHDQAILNEHPKWTVDYLDWTSSKFKSKALKLFSGLKKKIANYILTYNLYTDEFDPLLINRFYFWQLKKAIAFKADLYIAHYPDCLNIAFKAAKANNAYFAFDAEDYHRGEDLHPSKIKLIKKIEDLVLPSAKYISVSSALIGDEYQKLYPKVPVVNIENMFPIKSQPPLKKIHNEVFKFFWFSQTIGPKRGLEEFIAILGKTNKKNIQLSLLGNVLKSFQSELNDHWYTAGLPSKGLVFINTVPEREIFDIASGHHFGLALETAHSHNRDICLTNKLYTYILSGNFLILSNTAGQKKFHQTHPQTGICLKLENIEHSAKKLEELFLDIETVNHARQSNYKLGESELNFDREKQFLIRRVNSLWK